MDGGQARFGRDTDHRRPALAGAFVGMAGASERREWSLDSVIAYDAVRTGQFVADVGRMASAPADPDAAGDGIVGVDDLGRAVYANLAAASLLGAQIEDIVGHPLHDVLHPNHPDAGQAYEREKVRSAAHSRMVRCSVCPMTRSIVLMVRRFPSNTAAQIWHRDRVTGAAVVFRDAAESRRLERVWGG